MSLFVLMKTFYYVTILQQYRASIERFVIKEHLGHEWFCLGSSHSYTVSQTVVRGEEAGKGAAGILEQGDVWDCSSKMVL